MPYTISQLFQVSFKPVLEDMLGSYPFVSLPLRCRYNHGKIRVQALGAFVQLGGFSSPSRQYEVSELSTPIIWYPNDDIIHNTESKRIEFTRNLILKSIKAHDQELFHRIGRGKAIVSRNYNYDRGEVVEMPNSNLYVCKLYTVVCFLPADAWN